MLNMIGGITIIFLQLFARYQLLLYLQPLKEEEPQGTFVGNIKTMVYDNDVLEKGQLDNATFVLFGKYSINSLLQIDKVTGILVTKTRIDIDTLCQRLQECCQSTKNQMIKVCSIEFLIKVTYRNKNLKIFKFSLPIKDINDNAPQFQDKIFRIESKENQIPGKIAVLPSAIDKDYGSNSKLEYAIDGNKNEIKFFSIKHTFVLSEQKIELYSHISFDRELTSEYVFFLIAKDNDNKEARMTIKVKIIDENDSAPNFNFDSNSIMKIKIVENCEIGSKITSFNVTDADEGINGNIFYSLNYNNAKTIRFLPFSINKNGLLFVSGSIDREMVDVYEITITATDGGVPSQMNSVKLNIEILDLNDNKPEFILSTDHSLNYFVVEENSELDTNIGTVQVIDQDKDLNARVECQIEENMFSKFLKLEKFDNFNIFKIQTKANIDREVMSQLLLVVKCRDFGDFPLTSSITVTIDVQDLNDNYPTVDLSTSDLNWEVMENNLKQSYINHIKATDLDSQNNGKLYFFINDSDTVSLSQFSIDSDQGIIKSKIVFDREVQDSYKFVVYIRDCGLIPLSTSVTITITILDENDNAPMFFTANPLYISIVENTSPPYVVARLNCKDRDQNMNGKVVFILEDNIDFFSLLESGVLSLKRSIDRETNSNFKFKVIAKDHGMRPLSSSINIVIEVKDVNDNAPEFIFPSTDLKMNVSFDYTIGRKLITRIVATDSDAGENGVVVFEHEERVIHNNKLINHAKDVKQYFSINKNNGELTVINSLQSLYHMKRLITIYAKDMGYPSLRSSVKIEISVVDARNPMYMNKASLNSDHDIFNISVIIIGCISVIIITVMIGAVMMLIFQKERTHRQDADSCLMTSLSGKATSAMNEYELSSRSSINKNISKSLSNIHLMPDNKHSSNIRPVKFNFAKNTNHNASYYEIIIPKDHLNNQTLTKDMVSTYQEAMHNNQSKLFNSSKIPCFKESTDKIYFDKTSLV